MPGKKPNTRGLHRSRGRRRNQHHRPVESGLVLGIHEDEAMVLTLADGRRIVVTVVEARPGRCRLHTAAPRDVVVLRAALLESAA